MFNALDLPKKTKIVSTLGPASQTPEIIQKLYDEGVNVFRLNFSHGTHESHGKMIDTIRSLNLNAAIMLDTKGPEIRTGEIRDKLSVKEGDEFIMTIVPGVYEDTGKISVSYPEFIDDVDVEDVIVIDSGVVQAECIEKEGDDLKFRVIEGQCDITTKRHINLHGRPVSLPTVTEQDWKDIDFGIEKKVDFIALSFVRTGEDVAEVKKHCQDKGCDIQIISKIENFESTQNLEAIIRESDAVMFARGDLSCEISFGEVPTMQKKMAALCSYYNRPIIIATQLVLSMVKNIQPTRAEVSDVGNAIFEGADAIMTSDETTKSPHPVLVIKTMSKIAKETESNIYSICEKPDCDDCFGVLHRGRLQRSGFESNVSLRRRANKSKKKSDLNTSMESVKRKFSCTSLDVSPNTFKENIISILPFVTDDIECLVAVHNHNDDYIKNIASSRLNIPMFGFTNNKMLCNQMNLIWNVQSVYDEKINEDYVNNMRRVDEFMKERDVIKYLLVGDLVTNGKKCTTIQVRNL
jgi:pyruvate kinase